MSYVAAMLLIYLKPFPAFVCLCNLINAPSILGLYRLDRAAIKNRYHIFLMILNAHAPALARHIKSINLVPELFLLEWFLTLYTKPLSLELASLVWDLFLLDGEVVLYMVGIAIFLMVEPQLMGQDLESWCEVREKNNYKFLSYV